MAELDCYDDTSESSAMAIDTDKVSDSNKDQSQAYTSEMDSDCQLKPDSVNADCLSYQANYDGFVVNYSYLNGRLKQLLSFYLTS